MNQLTEDQITDQLYHATYGHPIIKTPFGSKYLINADVTATGFPNQWVNNFISNQIIPYYSNTHSNAFSGRLMSHYINQSKQIIRVSIGAKDNDSIIFTGNGCSGAVIHLIHCLNLQNSNPDKTVVLISRAEHHSNHLPWTHLPITLKYIPLLKNGLINTLILERFLIQYQQKNYKIYVSLIATSNVTGVHQKTNVISQMVHRYGGFIFWDFAASAPYLPINMHSDDMNGVYYDAIFISMHKFFGGPGTPGLLVANRCLFQNHVPFCPGGGTVRFVCPTIQVYSTSIETKETGGTPNIIGSIQAGLAFDLKNRYLAHIMRRETQLVQQVQTALSHIPKLNLLNQYENLHRQPVFVFTIDQLHYNLIVAILSDLFGIQTRGGISCCSLLAQDLLDIGPLQQKYIHDQIINNQGVPPEYGWCRVSFHYTMPNFLVQFILDAIKIVAQYGHQIARLYYYNPHNNTWNCIKNDLGQYRLQLDQYFKRTRTVYLTPTMLQQQMYQIKTLINGAGFVSLTDN